MLSVHSKEQWLGWGGFVFVLINFGLNVRQCNARLILREVFE